MTREEISEQTGFDNGDEFLNEQEVRDYFQLANLRERVYSGGGQGEMLTQRDLDLMADEVVSNRWHCAF